MDIQRERKPGRKWLGNALSQFNLYLGKSRPRVDGRQTTAYTFDSEKVKEISEIYLRETPQNDVHNVHNVNVPNKNSKLDGAKEKSCSRTGAHSVHDCSRTEKGSCTPYVTENTNKKDAVHDVHENLPPLTEKNFTFFFPDEEVEVEL